MPTTRYKLAEQLQERLKGGAAMGGDVPHRLSLYETLNQVINFKIKGQWFENANFAGARIPDGLLLATYDGIEVESYKNVSRSILPAQPVYLPKNIGVFYIGPTDGTLTSGNNNDLNCPFIPIASGLKAALATERVIAEMLGAGMYGYECFGNQVIYTHDLTREAVPITQVIMRLLVMQINEYSDYEALPIPADWELEILDMAFEKLAGNSISTKTNDQVTGQQKV